MVQTSIALDAKSKATLKRLQESHDPDVLREGLVEFFSKQAMFAAASIQKNQLSGQKVGVRTGQLRASITGRGELVGRVPALRVGVFRGPAIKYAGVQEYGTRGKNPNSPFDTIRPKSGRALAVPVGKALTPAGVARFPSMRDFPEPLVPITGAGISKGRFIGVLVTQASIDGAAAGAPIRELDVVALLLSAVDIAPKWYLRDGFNEFMPTLVKRLGRHLKDVALGKGKAG